MHSAARKAAALARLGRRLLKSPDHWARVNPRLIFGEHLTDAQYNRLAQLAFENIFLSHIEGVRASDVAFDTDGGETLRDAYAQGQGVICAAIHLGSWEPGLMHVARLGYPLSAVYRHANNPLAEQMFMAIRQPYGIGWIARRDAKQTISVLKRKQMLGLMIDINTAEGGVAAPFLGFPALCPAGPARLARKFGAPIVPMIATREAPGRATLRIGPVLEPLPGEDDAAFTARLNAAFTDWIVDYAHQYNWLHGRFKSRPDGRLWRRSEPLASMMGERDTPFLTPSAKLLEALA
ncbi:putative lipid A biosynthesis acyltransferase [Magnetofaba australis IT-1]|uniref:Putative lipid A biosynthesis acyltransferase n=2 Tax=Magnetofaba TaxID=1472292 RepID=A0A1Y2K8E8_9PROT|nr:putative lipid A biosynthesis acyltransferase [Magnetofaba australis IT-1]